jgi:N-methylhydantoinase A
MDVRYRLGVDIGGTFTDVVLLGDDGSLHTMKVLSTPDDYARGVVEGALALLRRSDLEPGRVHGVVHASTVASNAVLEHKGARTALLTTEGFRDVLEMRRLRIPVMYDLQYEKPEPLVPRRRRFEVPERLGPDGCVWRELDEAAVDAIAARLPADGVEAVAISLLHAYASPAHEQRVAEIVRAHVGEEVFVTCSSEILPEIREYERTSTAVVNAYVGPAVRRYVSSLQDRLRRAGVTAPLQIMQSSGGIMSADAAIRLPAHLVESGPSAGVVACSFLARETGLGNVISLDMGGTTAKAAILEDGEPVRTSEYEVGAGINLSSRLVKGGGYAIRLPFIDLSEIGAGGGSIVRVDELGGPESAGSDPGPVGYARGGTEPTLTDALLTLGYLNPGSLAGGGVELDADAARRAIEERVARPLGLSAQDAAYGVFTLAAATMTRAVKAVSTYRGRDPRDFVLCAFGGNGPVAAAAIARALQMRRVLVPPAPGVFSATGLLLADVEREFVQTLLTRAADAGPETLGRAYAALEAVARDSLGHDGYTAADIELVRSADVRYAGQAYELTVPVGANGADPTVLANAFHREHERTYGHASTGDPVDVVNVKVRARVPRGARGTLRGGPDGRAEPAAEGSRRAYFGAAHGLLDVPVLTRSLLTAGERPGPLIVDEYDSTCVVPPGCRAALDALGNLDIHVDV